MRKFYKFLSIMVVLSLLLSYFPYVSAASAISPRYIVIQSFTLDFNINAAGDAECKGSVEVRDTSLVKLSLELQRYQNGGWTTVKTWNKTGTGIASLYTTKNVSKGYTYRLVVTGYVYSSNNIVIEREEGIKASYY